MTSVLVRLNWNNSIHSLALSSPLLTGGLNLQECAACCEILAK